MGSESVHNTKSRAAAEEKISSTKSVDRMGEGGSNESKGCGVGAHSWQPSIANSSKQHLPSSHITTSAAHALGAFLVDMGASIAHTAAQHVNNSALSRGGHLVARTTEEQSLTIKHVEGAMQVLLGKEKAPELLELAVAAGYKADGKIAASKRTQATRSKVSFAASYSTPQKTFEGVLDLEALMSAGSAADVIFDLELAEELLCEAMPQSQAGQNPEVTCTVGAAVFLAAVLECVLHFKFHFGKLNLNLFASFRIFGMNLFSFSFDLFFVQCCLFLLPW